MKRLIAAATATVATIASIATPVNARMASEVLASEIMWEDGYRTAAVAIKTGRRVNVWWFNCDTGQYIIYNANSSQVVQAGDAYMNGKGQWLEKACAPWYY